LGKFSGANCGTPVRDGRLPHHRFGRQLRRHYLRTSTDKRNIMSETDRRVDCYYGGAGFIGSNSTLK